MEPDILISQIAKILTWAIIIGGNNHTRLKIAKILFTEPRLFIYSYIVSLKWTRNFFPRLLLSNPFLSINCIDIVLGDFQLLVGCQSTQDALGSLAGSAVWGGEDANGIIVPQHLFEAATSIFSLCPSIFGELDAVVGDILVDFAVFVALGLSMADEDD